MLGGVSLLDKPTKKGFVREGTRWSLSGGHDQAATFLKMHAPRPRKGLVRHPDLSPVLMTQPRERCVFSLRRSHGSRPGMERPQDVFKAGTGMAVSKRRDPVQQRFDGTRRRQVEENAVLVLFDLRGHLEQGEDHGGRLGRGQGRVGERVRAEGMVEDIGGARQQEPHGVGEERRRRGAVAVEVTLDRLDIVFAIPPRAVEVFIHLLGRRRLQDVTTKRGLSPAAMTSALTITRHGWAHEAAA